MASPEKSKGGKAQALGDAKAIKAKWLAAKSVAEQDAVLAEANALKWSDVDHQDLAVFFETELAKRRAPKKKTMGEGPVEEVPSEAAVTQMRIETEE